MYFRYVSRFFIPGPCIATRFACDGGHPEGGHVPLLSKRCVSPFFEAGTCTASLEAVRVPFPGSPTQPGKDRGHVPKVHVPFRAAPPHFCRSLLGIRTGDKDRGHVPLLSKRYVSPFRDPPSRDPQLSPGKDRGHVPKVHVPFRAAPPHFCRSLLGIRTEDKDRGHVPLLSKRYVSPFCRGESRLVASGAGTPYTKPGRK